MKYEGSTLWDTPPALKDLAKKHPPIGNYSDQSPKHLDLLSPIIETMRKKRFQEEINAITFVIKTASMIGHPDLPLANQHLRNLIAEGNRYSIKGAFYYSACRDAITPMFEDVCMLSGLGYPPTYDLNTDMVDLRMVFNERAHKLIDKDDMHTVASQLFRKIREYNNLLPIEGKDKVDLIAKYKHLYLSPQNLAKYTKDFHTYVCEVCMACNDVTHHIHNYK